MCQQPFLKVLAALLHYVPEIAHAPISHHLECHIDTCTVQMLAADVLHFLPTFQRPLLSALAFACNPPQGLPTNHASFPSVRVASRYPQAIALRLLHCISSKSASLLPEDFLSFLLTVLIGNSSTPPPAGSLTSGERAEVAADSNARRRGTTNAAGNVGQEDGELVATWAARGELLKVLQTCMTQSQAAGEEHEWPPKPKHGCLTWHTRVHAV